MKQELGNECPLTHKELVLIRDRAIQFILTLNRNPNETHENFITRCWWLGIMNAMSGLGYKICLEKNGSIYQFPLS